MDWNGAALGLAGIVGCVTAIVHGVLVQRLMVRPMDALLAGERRIGGPVIRRLFPPLLQFSTYSWFLGGLALIAAGSWLGPQARLAVGLLVGADYLFGAVGNFQATRGRHPGWMLMALALLLIAVGLVA